MNTDSVYNTSSAAIGIDLGGTKTEAILLNSDGAVLWRQRRPTRCCLDGFETYIVWGHDK